MNKMTNDEERALKNAGRVKNKSNQEMRNELERSIPWEAKWSLAAIESEVVRQVAENYELWIIGENPKIETGTYNSKSRDWRDSEGRLHRIGGPASIGELWRNGRRPKSWYFHGVCWKEECANCGQVVFELSHSCASSSSCCMKNLAAGESDDKNN